MVSKNGPYAKIKIKKTDNEHRALCNGCRAFFNRYSLKQLKHCNKTIESAEQTENCK